MQIVLVSRPWLSFLLFLHLHYSYGAVNTNDNSRNTKDIDNKSTSCTSALFTDDDSCNDGDGNNSIEKVYQISTLHSAPKRCLHVVERQPITKVKACLDDEDWHDGINGCTSFNLDANQSWCNLYGNSPDSKYPHITARDACCVCGDRVQDKTLRFGLESRVQIKHFPSSCVWKVVETIHPRTKTVQYKVELTKDCGQSTYPVVQADGMLAFGPKYKAGRTKIIFSDVAVDIWEYEDKIDDMLMLKKCRRGISQQEFHVLPVLNISTTTYKLQHVESKRNITIFQPKLVFEEKKHRFKDSDEYFYIKLEDGQEHEFLSYGKFGQVEYKHPQRERNMKLDTLTSYSMWSYREIMPVSKTETDDNDDEHARWLEQKVLSPGGLDHLKQLPPWYLLDVDREADKTEVKARFRSLSKRFHPDKQQKHSFPEVYLLLQNAYDGLKHSNEQEKEKFRTDAETEQQLFAHSTEVVELLPSHWRNVTKRDGSGKYHFVLSFSNSTTEEENSHKEADNIITTEDEERDCINNDCRESVPQYRVWLLFLYSPRCGMSRSVVPFLELAAKHLRHQAIEKSPNETIYKDHIDTDIIRVGVYGCGIHDHRNKQLGFVAAFEDPICKQFGRPETPNTHVFIETITNGTEPFRDKHEQRLAEFTSFHVKAATGTIHDLWPSKFIQFATKAKVAWEDSQLVEYFSYKDFAKNNTAFQSTIRVIAFFDNKNEQLNEVQASILESISLVARRLKEGRVRVGIVYCASESEANDDDFVDCSELDITFVPDIKIYGVNQTTGISLIGNDFLERRDVQIAIETMTNTLVAALGIEKVTRIVDENDKNEDQQQEGQEEGSCSNNGGQQYDPFFDEEAPEKFELSEPEDLSVIDDYDTINQEEPKEKLESSNKAKLAAPAPGLNKAKLAKISSNDNFIDTRKTKTRQVGGGTIYGGGAAGVGGFIGG